MKGFGLMSLLSLLLKLCRPDECWILKLRPNEHKNVPGPAEESSRSVGHWNCGQGRTMYNGLTRTGVATLHE